MKKKQNPTIQHVIFDLDGTIIDTELTAARVVQKIFLEWGIEVNPTDASFLTGRTWELALKFLSQKYPVPLPLDQLTELCLTRYRSALNENLEIVPGSIQAIQNLAPHYPLGLVSGSGRREILWALEKLNVASCFQIILGAEDYPRSKPHPDGYQKAVNFFGADPKTCLVFEDSEAGIHSALQAGLWVVAITCANHFGNPTQGAHLSISDLTSVNEKWIQKLPFLKNDGELQ